MGRKRPIRLAGSDARQGAAMNKFVVGMVGLFAAILAYPASAQQVVASLETSRIVIAPPQSAIARTIKDDLSAAYYASRAGTQSYDDAQRLYFLYGERHFAPIWLSENADGQVAFSPAADKIIALFRDA